MTAAQIPLAAVMAAIIAAGCLASLPAFEPARRGWLTRFGWILLRYVLPLVAMVTVISWLLLKR